MGDFQGREPCPARIIDDIGSAFAIGVLGGGVWHSVKGFRNAPKGKGLFFAIDGMKARAPVTGGSFATWGCLFASCDCTFAAIRHKEDPWNGIASGAATGGLLAIRAGPRAAGKNALIGGILLAAIEGLGIMMTKMLAPPVPTAEQYAQQGQVDPLEPPSMMPSFNSSSLSDIFAPSSDDGPTSFDMDTDSSSASLSSGSSTSAAATPSKAWYNPF